MTLFTPATILSPVVYLRSASEKAAESAAFSLFMLLANSNRGNVDY